MPIDVTGKAGAAYVNKAASEVGYVDAKGRSIVVLCVHTDVPFDVLVEEITKDKARSLLPLLHGRCEFLDSHVMRDLKA
jgi:hypothetical protein